MIDHLLDDGVDAVLAAASQRNPRARRVRCRNPFYAEAQIVKPAEMVPNSQFYRAREEPAFLGAAILEFAFANNERRVAQTEVGAEPVALLRIVWSGSSGIAVEHRRAENHVLPVGTRPDEHAHAR